MAAASRSGVAAFCVLFALSGCTRDSSPVPPPAAGSVSFTTFTDVVESTGIHFLHDNGFDGKRYRVEETVNGGLALLDFDLDGRLDVFFTNAQALDAPSPRVGAGDALYRQGADRKFTDVSRKAGVDDAGFSLGCSVADLDGDGFPEILVTRRGANRLLLNGRDGVFRDIAASAGIASEGIHSGSAFLDMDLDGDLDVYIASYTVDPGGDYGPLRVRGVPGYWPPRNYKPADHHLYENRGDLKFVDVSEASGIRNLSTEPGRGLGVISADFNNDGRPDIYVANDMSANFLFLGDGKGRFAEQGLSSGAALGDQGEELGSMGLDSADYNGDGILDICVTNYQNQINNLYRGSPTGFFEDMARSAGVTRGSLPDVSWGTAFQDFDNDGRVDLFIASGHLNPGTHEMDESTSYAQAKRIYKNIDGNRFEDVSPRSGAAISTPHVSRGAAFGDIDDDGDVDVIVMEASGKPEVLRNDLPPGATWCLIELKGVRQNVDAIGARVRITAGGRAQLREKRSSGSYLSANDPRLHFGLGVAKRIDRLEIDWPDGTKQSFADLPVGQLLRITLGRETVELPWSLEK